MTRVFTTPRHRTQESKRVRAQCAVRVSHDAVSLVIREVSQLRIGRRDLVRRARRGSVLQGRQARMVGGKNLCCCFGQRGEERYPDLVEHPDKVSRRCCMTEDSPLAQIVKQRLRVTQHLSKLNAQHVFCLQAKGGAEIEVSRLRLDIERGGETPALLSALEQAERHLASIKSDIVTCSLGIVTSETELDDLDKRLGEP